ncbi:hypothetical protein SLAVM298S_07851 [Streptomyces lavendulae subsp. lavendulae]
MLRSEERAPLWVRTARVSSGSGAKLLVAGLQVAAGRVVLHRDPTAGLERQFVSATEVSAFRVVSNQCSSVRLVARAMVSKPWRKGSSNSSAPSGRSPS